MCLTSWIICLKTLILSGINVKYCSGVQREIVYKKYNCIKNAMQPHNRILHSIHIKKPCFKASFVL